MGCAAALASTVDDQIARSVLLLCWSRPLDWAMPQALHALRQPRRRDARALARPAGRGDLRADAADDAHGGRPGRGAAAAAAVRHRRAPAAPGLLSIVYLLACAVPGCAAPLQLAAFAVSRWARWWAFRSSRWRCARSMPMHAAVVTGLLPLATAVAAALCCASGPRRASGPCAVAGCALVVAFALLRGSGRPEPGRCAAAFAVTSAAVGYVAGAAGSRRCRRAGDLLGAGAEPAADAARDAAGRPGRAGARVSWGAFAYVALFSMWLGFSSPGTAASRWAARCASARQLVQPFLRCWRRAAAGRTSRFCRHRGLLRSR